MYNIGLIGFGDIGSWHMRNLESMPDFEMSAVYDIDPFKVRLAQERGLKGYFALDEFLSDPGIQTILVAVPNNFHRELAIRAMRAGKNVICEKPAALNSEELSEMIQASEETHRLFSVHQNRRWDKDFLIMKKVLEDGIIGKPFYIESRVLGSKGIPGEWRCEKESGGGMLYDWGVHLIDQLMWLIPSPVKEVYAHLLSVRYPQVDDQFKLMLRFGNGLSALVEVGTYDFIPLPRWHVSGDRGTLRIDDFSCHGKIVRAKSPEHIEDNSVVYTAAGPTKTMAPRQTETMEELFLPDLDCDSKDYYRNFRDSDLYGSKLTVTPQESLKVMRVIDAAFRSAQTKQAVFL